MPPVRDRESELLDAQIIYHPHEVLPGEADLSLAERESIAVELVRASMDAVGIDRALWHGEPTLCQRAVSRHPDRFAGVVHLLDPVPDATETLEMIAETPGLVGIRLTPAFPFEGENMQRYRAGGYDDLLREAERLRLPLSIFVSGQVPMVNEIAQRYPELPVIVDHLGMMPSPIIPLTPQRFRDFPQVLELARYPNVAVKVTGSAALSLDGFPYDDVWPYVRQLIDVFGVERLMWGTDFMRVSPLYSYADAVRAFVTTDALTTEEKLWLGSRSARQWFGWEP